MEIFGGTFYFCDDVCGVPDGAEHATADNSPSCMCDFGEDSPPRVNFDSFFDAILAIFQVMTGEDWQFILYSAYRAIENSWAAFFFLTLFVVGNWILLNLFVAILISCLDTASSSDKKQGSGAARVLLLVMTTVTPLKRHITQAMQETIRANPNLNSCPDPNPDLNPEP